MFSPIIMLICKFIVKEMGHFPPHSAYTAKSLEKVPLHLASYIHFKYILL